MNIIYSFQEGETTHLEIGCSYLHFFTSTPVLMKTGMNVAFVPHDSWLPHPVNFTFIKVSKSTEVTLGEHSDTQYNAPNPNYRPHPLIRDKACLPRVVMTVPCLVCPM
jgi:hypothetical protein